MAWRISAEPMPAPFRAGSTASGPSSSAWKRPPSPTETSHSRTVPTSRPASSCATKASPSAGSLPRRSLWEDFFFHFKPMAASSRASRAAKSAARLLAQRGDSRRPDLCDLNGIFESEFKLFHRIDPFHSGRIVNKPRRRAENGPPGVVGDGQNRQMT